MDTQQRDIPWPRPQDKLFISGGRGNLAGHVLNPIFSSPADFGITAEGYKAAGDALIDWMANNPRNDSLVPPTVFCYRQYVELRLKDIILLVNTSDQTGERYEKIHDLRRLWTTLLSGIGQRIDDANREALILS